MNFLIKRCLPICSKHIPHLMHNQTNAIVLNRFNSRNTINSNQTMRYSSTTVNLLVFGQIAPVIGLIVGRVIQRQWPHLRHVDSRTICKSLSDHKLAVSAAIGLTGGVCAAITRRYTEKTPVTGRQRFVIFNKKDYEPVSEMMFKIVYQAFRHKILPVEHKTTRKVYSIVSKLLESNKDMEEIANKKWAIYVISDPQTANAFVLPTGHIFVYTGIMRMCDNDDQLASILAHELSHTLLSHGKEVLTQEFVVDLVQAAATTLIWVRFRTIPALAATIIATFGIKSAFLLPKRRKIETEADIVGLKLAAKACYDIREGSAFWMKMAALEQKTVISELSTHPSNSSRSELMDSYMDEMFKLMECHNCPKLSDKDPRDAVRKRFAEVDRTIEIKIK